MVNDKLRIQHKETLKRLEQSGLSRADIEIIGGTSARLEIPLTDRFTLRKVPDILRGLAAVIENHSRREDWSERVVMLEVKSEIRDYARRLREIHGVDNFNKNGTLKAVDKLND